MDPVDIFLDAANAIQFVAVILLTRAIIRDRKVVKGLSVSGSFTNLIAISCFEVAFVLLNNYISVALGIVGLTFWLVAFLFTFRKWINERKHQTHSLRERACLV